MFGRVSVVHLVPCACACRTIPSQHFSGGRDDLGQVHAPETQRAPKELGTIEKEHPGLPWKGDRGGSGGDLGLTHLQRRALGYCGLEGTSEIMS